MGPQTVIDRPNHVLVVLEHFKATFFLPVGPFSVFLSILQCHVATGWCARPTEFCPSFLPNFAIPFFCATLSGLSPCISWFADKPQPWFSFKQQVLAATLLAPRPLLSDCGAPTYI